MNIRNRSNILVSLTLLGLTALLPQHAQAGSQPLSWFNDRIDTTIYMASDGTGNGSSASSPTSSLRTALQNARNITTDATNPRDVKIYMANGTYTVGASGDLQGAALDRVVMVEGQSAGGVIITGADEPGFYIHGYKRNVVLRNLVFKDFNKTAVLVMNGATGTASTAIADHDNWLVENCEWNNNGDSLTVGSRDNNRSPAANFSHMQNFTMRNCKFQNNGGPGLDFKGRDSSLEDLTVTGNFTKGSGTGTAVGGMNFMGLRVSILRSKFNSNALTGLQMDMVAENVTIDRCEFNSNGRKGMVWETAYGPVTVKNSQINNNSDAGVGLATAYDFTFERCFVQNNGTTQFDILNKDRPIDADGCTGDANLCALGAGDLDLPAGSQWTNTKSMSWVKRTKIWNCTVTTNNSARLISKELINGSGGEYRNWVRNELNADYNTYYSTQGTNVFDIGASYDSYQLVNFAAWKTDQNVNSAQGDDEHSRWGVAGASAGEPSNGRLYRLKNRQYSQYLDGDSSSLVDMDSSSSGTDKVWTLQDADSGYFYLLNQGFNQRLDADNSGSVDVNDVNLDGSTATGNDKQWLFVSSGDGYYYLTNRQFNRRLDGDGSNNADLYGSLDGTSFDVRWHLEEAG